jgi:hypothetical protein
LVGNAGSGKAGVYNWTRTGGSVAPPPAVGTGFVGFCIELESGISTGTEVTFTVELLKDAPKPDSALAGPPVGPGGMGAAKANLIKELWGENLGTIVDDETAAAFQIAVWEIVYDDGLSVSSGDLAFGADTHAGKDAPGKAQDLLDSLDGTGSFASLMGLTSDLRPGRYQDQVIEGPENWVPLPASAWGGLVLLGGLVAGRVRSRRSA